MLDSLLITTWKAGLCLKKNVFKKKKKQAEKRSLTRSVEHHQIVNHGRQLLYTRRALKLNRKTFDFFVGRVVVGLTRIKRRLQDEHHG
jgi:hypothetical protein